MNTLTEQNFSRLSRIHQASVLVGELYAEYYRELDEGNQHVEDADVELLFEMHKNLRRMLPKNPVNGKRIGSEDAYRATRG